MAVRALLARWAVRGAAVLVVEVPGGWAARVAVQRALVVRGWREASSPADADALVVCGAPGGGWADVLERTWAQLPGPRSRASVLSAGDAVGALDALAADLLDDGAQRADAASRSLVPGDVGEGDDMHPAGLELAGGEDDLRDGLGMDVLHVPLGPVLPDWPAGLVLRTVLSGDVVVRAEVEVLPGAEDALGGEAAERTDAAVPEGVARRLDAAARVLRLAGAPDLAARAVRLRDAPPPPRLRGLSTSNGGQNAEEAHEVRGVRELRGRVERSRVLRWSLRASTSAETDERHDAWAEILRNVRLEPPADQRDVVWTLLLHLLDPAAHDDDPAGRTRAALDALPGLLVGVELVTARLLVAALDLRTDALAEVARG